VFRLSRGGSNPPLRWLFPVSSNWLGIAGDLAPGPQRPVTEPHPSHDKGPVDWAKGAAVLAVAAVISHDEVLLRPQPPFPIVILMLVRPAVQVGFFQKGVVDIYQPPLQPDVFVRQPDNAFDVPTVLLHWVSYHHNVAANQLLLANSKRPGQNVLPTDQGWRHAVTPHLVAG
jgi:hypothetical protein